MEKKATDLPEIIDAQGHPDIRPGWSLPTAGICEECGEPEELGAYLDDDGWYLSVACPDACEPEDVSWPFADDVKVKGAQLEALGFKIY